MEFKKFEKDMAAFSFGQHQDVLTYLTHLESKGWTIEDAKKWVQSEKERMGKQSEDLEEQQKALASLFKCPDCQSPFWVLPVNTGPGDQTGDDSKSVMLCTNRECMHAEYSTKTVQRTDERIIKQIGGRSWLYRIIP